MDELRIGLIADRSASTGSISEAIKAQPGLTVREFGPGSSSFVDIDAIVVDTPLETRARILSNVIGSWPGPILVEAPVSGSVEGAQRVLENAKVTQLHSMNPLHHHLPTQRLFGQIHTSDDPLQTIFASWRSHASNDLTVQTIQLLDYLQSLLASPIQRISALSRTAPEVTIAILRDERGVVCSLEVGDHLPASVPEESDLLVECYCRESVLHCRPDQQIVSVSGRNATQRDWSPKAAGEMVKAWLQIIRDDQPPIRAASKDLAALRLHHQIVAAARNRTTVYATGEATAE